MEQDSIHMPEQNHATEPQWYRVVRYTKGAEPEMVLDFIPHPVLAHVLCRDLDCERTSV